MAREIEIKLRVTDAAAVRGRLAEAGADAGGAVMEINTIFDRPDGSLRRAGCGLRVRTCSELQGGQPLSACLTFKGPRERGQLKDREELETSIDSPETLTAILIALGYAAVIVYEKRRETWHWRDCEVVLDELPQLGWFLEIEGPGAAEIDAVRAAIGMADASLVDESYVTLAERHGQLVPNGPTALRF